MLEIACIAVALASWRFMRLNATTVPHLDILSTCVLIVTGWSTGGALGVIFGRHGMMLIGAFGASIASVMVWLIEMR